MEKQKDNNMIKAAFFDIDGTLLSFKTHQVSQGTIKAFDILHRHGIHTFIASGRPKILFPTFPITFEGYITMNGGYVYVDNQVLLSNPIPRDESQRWLQYVEDNNLATMCFTDNNMSLNRIDPVGVKIREQLEFEMPPIVPIQEMAERDIYQFIALTPAEKDRDIEALLPHCRMPRWHPAFTDIINADNSKAVGMERILHHFGLTNKECIAFGDGGNDIEMLEYAHIGVAMGNAADNVKAKADYVTTSVDEEGIFTALQQLHIIDD